LPKARRAAFRRFINIKAQVDNEEDNNGRGEVYSGELIPVSL
jgi:hypothetical protein